MLGKRFFSHRLVEIPSFTKGQEEAKLEGTGERRVYLEYLEYRLYDQESNFPVLYQYENMDSGEVSSRLLCDYFIKDGQVFEKVSTAVGPKEVILFVTEAEDEEVINEERVTCPDWEGIRLEIRHYKEGAVYYPVVKYLHFSSHGEVSLYLASDSFCVDGSEWRKTSTEIDENRKVFVIYGEPMK